jgi:C4-dicarboxylate-specific signal transduction histidine kinase
MQAEERRHEFRRRLAMPRVSSLSMSYWKIGFFYLASYVLLDWISYVHPISSFGITPWNPPPGLSFALIILFGPKFLPWLFIAPLCADALVRQFPLPTWAELAAALIIGGGYALGAGVLISRRVGFDPGFVHKRDLLLLMAAAALTTAVVSVSYVALVVAIALMPPDQFAAAALRYWIGDVIGIAVVTPFILVLFTRRRVQLPVWEMCLLLAALAAALWLIVGVKEFRFQLFYLLFVPVIWTAVRLGLEGVTVGLAVTQIGLMAAIHLAGQSDIDVVAFQALMIVLAMTGLAVGVLVREQQRTQHQLRLHQEAIARVMRLGSMGELAAALAHELNQPLTAIGNYVRLARDAAAPPSPDLPTVAEASAKAVEQVERAAQVVRRIREFVRLGRCDAAAVALPSIAAQVQALIGPELDHMGILFETRVGNVPPVAVDTLQIQQVILNLVRNAADSLSQAGRYDGRIEIVATADEPGFVRVSVRDNGPGFDPALAADAIAPFTTTKPDGMGLGLTLSRSIIEAHRGRLWIGGDAAGAVVSFTLPIAGTNTGRAT